jgi:hypothetical protein
MWNKQIIKAIVILLGIISIIGGIYGIIEENNLFLFIMIVLSGILSLALLYEKFRQRFYKRIRLRHIVFVQIIFWCLYSIGRVSIDRDAFIAQGIDTFAQGVGVVCIVLPCLLILSGFFHLLTLCGFFQFIRKNSRAIILVFVLAILFASLSFQYIEGYGITTKEHLTFNNTFVSSENIGRIIDKYNNANFFERQAIAQEPLFRKLVEIGRIGKEED